MAKRKAGLQKDISLIFKDMPVPKANGTGPPGTGYAPPKGPPAVDRRPMPKPEPPRPATTPKASPPAWALPKAVVAKRPGVDAVIKAFKRIPGQQAWQQTKDRLFAERPGVSSARQKIMAILVVVLFIVLIFVLIRVFGTPLRKASTGPRGFGPAIAAAASNSKIDGQIPEPYPATLRDPMQFGAMTTVHGETRKLIVKGILYSEDEPSAVIGTKIVREGDRVLGATVVKINKDSVDFEKDGEIWRQKVQR